MPDIESGNHTIILGGGISGLATAWYLFKAGIPFTLFEKKAETGGVILSNEMQGTVMDFGPNSLRDRNGDIRELVKELGLFDDLIQISEVFKTRFIVRNGKLHSLSPNLTSAISTKVLSGKGKRRLLAEPFISKGPPDDESVGGFLERRVGKEVVEYLADPVFSGIYAGDIYQVSKNVILPKLAEYEKEFGSIFWGAIRSKKDKALKPVVLSFKKGIQQLTDTMANRLSEYIIHDEVQSLRKVHDGFEVSTTRGDFKAGRVISCIPAYSLARVLDGFEPAFTATLNEIDYAPILSTQIIFDKESLALENTGFGFLVPRKENIRLLGAIWKSSIFPELTSGEKALFTLMTGGAHDRNILFSEIEDIEREILDEFSSIMGIVEKPEVIKSKLWQKAIPQFEVGYEKVKAKIKQIEESYMGLYIGGNYRWGVSVPDCINGAKELIWHQFIKNTSNEGCDFR